MPIPIDATEPDKVVVRWIEDGVLLEETYSNNRFKKLKIKSCKAFEPKYLKIKPSEVIDYQQKFTGVSKIAILSDIHGQHDLFKDMLNI